MKDLWFKLDVLHETLASIYQNNFSNKEKKELLHTFNIDCGTDYADYIFYNADLLDFYNGN